MNSKFIVNNLIKYYKRSRISKNKLVSALAHWSLDQFLHIFLSLPKNNIQTVNGVKMYLDYSKKYGSYERYFGIHEEEQIKFFQTLLKEDDVVFDLGAYQGDYALVAAKVIGKRGKVYAFEPEPERYGVLKKNIELNSFTNIEIVTLACYDKDGTVRFSKDGRCLFEHEHEADEKIFQSTSLDSFVQSKKIIPKIIKIDVEGSELLVLKGMRKILSSKLYILLELHPSLLPSGQTDVDSIVKLLDTYGFKIFDYQTRSVINPENNNEFNKNQPTWHVFATNVDSFDFNVLSGQ